MITKNPFQEILNEKKLRQRDLAIVCDLSFSTVSNVVKGEYKKLSIRDMFAVFEKILHSGHTAPQFTDLGLESDI